MGLGNGGMVVMIVSAAAAPSAVSLAKLFFLRSSPFSSSSSSCWNPILRIRSSRTTFFSSPLPPSARTIVAFSTATATKPISKKKKKKNGETAASAAALATSKRRTRSEKEVDIDQMERRFGGGGGGHIPVLLGEVLDVFSSTHLRSFIDCTLGAAGHSSAIIEAHQELELYIGLDVDPIAHEKARARIDSLLCRDSCAGTCELKAYTPLKNFKNVKTVLSEVSHEHLTSGIDGILMDLGMSSMQVNNAARGFSLISSGPLDMRMDPQATLKAEDILNSWPETEVGRILRDYGEESNWFSLQNKIMKARLGGGLHSTGELVELIRQSTPRTKGRKGWIKTSTRVFQALRIAVNDELRTLEHSLYACFDCLAPGGRLAVISFHSLEDRIVKQTFLSMINSKTEAGVGREEQTVKIQMENSGSVETWIKQMVRGPNGVILTKRPITASEEEERLNRRCRSAKLRVIQKNL